MYVLPNNKEFELYSTENGLEIICENKPKDIEDLGIKFEE